jgi:hypothetical protein
MKVAQLRTKLKRAQKEKKSFEEAHKDILDLCTVIFDKKSDYANINVPYPEELIIVMNRLGKKVGKINLDPDIEPERTKLAKSLFEVLDRINKIYSLRKQLELDQALGVRKDLMAIKKDLDDIKRFLKMKHFAPNRQKHDAPSLKVLKERAFF